MQGSPPAETDVLVVGGGPAGSTVATLLARRGWRVALLEKDHHPRFHIGESLLPLNLPIFERLGVLEAVDAIGVRKFGADFPAQTDAGYGTFHFGRTLRPGWPFAYQVKREELDELLFRHAAANGADAHEGVQVGALAFEEGGVRAAFVDAQGQAGSVRARYVIDASGRDTWLGSRLGDKRKHRQHQSAALFAHFRDVRRRPDPDAGNISVYRFSHGWIWMIPLRDGLMSVGAVCWPAYLKQRRGDNAQFLLDTLRGIPDAWARMQDAQIAGNLHVTGNYSYQCRRLAGPRWMLVGDACAFVDPIFSSGVLLAMHGAERAAEAVDAILREPAREARLQRAYTRHVRRGIDAFSWFIFRFTAPPMAYLFANPRNVLRVEEAMISMLAGDVFDNRGVRWRLRVFKLIYWLHALAMLGRTARGLRWRRRQQDAGFSGGTTSQDHV